MKTFSTYLITAAMIAFAMRMSHQTWSEYFTPDLIVTLFLCGLAYAFTFKRREYQSLWRLLRGQALERESALQLLGSVRSFWRFLLTFIGVAFLLQSVYALSDVTDMAHLGTWMALALLGGLYLLLLRWGIFLPLEASLKRRLSQIAA